MDTNQNEINIAFVNEMMMQRSLQETEKDYIRVTESIDLPFRHCGIIVCRNPTNTFNSKSKFKPLHTYWKQKDE